VGANPRTRRLRQLLDLGEEVVPTTVEDFYTADTAPHLAFIAVGPLMNEEAFPRQQPPSARSRGAVETVRAITFDPARETNSVVREPAIARTPVRSGVVLVAQAESNRLVAVTALDPDLVGGKLIDDLPQRANARGRDVVLQAACVTVRNHWGHTGRTITDDHLDEFHGTAFPAAGDEPGHADVRRPV
jgi:hypothetical protein